MKRFPNFAALLLVIIFAVSCKNDKKEASNVKPECKECSIMAANYEFAVKIVNHEIPFQFWEGAAGHILDKSYMLGLSKNYKVSKEESQILLQELKLGNSTGITPENVMTYVVYSNIDNSGRSLSFDNIIGSAIYYVNGGKLNISVYKKSNGQLEQLQEFNSEVNCMPVLDFYKVGLIVKGDNKNLTSLVMSTDNYSQLEIKAITTISTNTFTHKLDVYFNNSKRFVFNENKDHNFTLGMDTREHAPIEYPMGCQGFPCQGGEGSCDYTPGQGAPICWGCSEEVMYSVAQQNTNSTIQDKLYAFRDDFMSQSTIGQHFVNDFYYCGKVVPSILTYSNATTGISLLTNDVIPMIDKLMASNAASDNSVLLTSTQATALINYVTALKNASSDATFDTIMDELIDNLTYASGKTVSTIYHDFGF